MIIIIILRVLSGDPTGYGAATSRVFAIYENFPGSGVSVFLQVNYMYLFKIPPEKKGNDRC
ncbi:hypothetical protein WR14_25160 [Escherichia coli]|nr:hypothetical protein WR14_25160 [Escherichia coli]